MASETFAVKTVRFPGNDRIRFAKPAEDSADPVFRRWIDAAGGVALEQFSDPGAEPAAERFPDSVGCPGGQQYDRTPGINQQGRAFPPRGITEFHCQAVDPAYVGRVFHDGYYTLFYRLFNRTGGVTAGFSIRRLENLHQQIYIPCRSVNIEIFQFRRCTMADIYGQIKEVEKRMEKTEEALLQQFGGLRTGKASPALVEGISVEYYGTQSRLRDIASITAPEPRLLLIQPWDATAVKAIEKALLNSNIGITPMTDGKSIKLPIPELSEERRGQLAKQAKAMTEDAKVALRNLRREANDAVKKAQKNSEITEDEQKKLLDDIQKKLDAKIVKLDAMLADKNKELMTV